MTSSLLDVRIGSQEPRVSTYPQAASSSGEDAVDLAEAAGLVLDPWQRYVLEHALGERPNGKWAAGEVACWVPRQNGKGAIIEARVLAGLVLFGEKRILWSAHEYKTAQEGFLRIKDLIQQAPDFDSRVKRYWEGSGEQGIELATGQRLKFIARSKGSGRGFSGDLIILDEAQELNLLQMKALYSTMSAKSIHGNPQIWFTGTPPENSAAWVYGLRKDGERGKDRLAYFDWGLGEVDPMVPLKTRLKQYADRDLWYRANPGLGIRISEEFCEDELSRLREGFASERLGLWLPYTGDEDNRWQLFPEAAWVARLDPAAKPDGPPAIAVDVTPNRATAAIGAAAMRAGGGRLVDVFEHRPGGGVRWVLGVLKELDQRYKPLVIVINDKALADEAEEAGLRVHRASPADVAAGAAALYDGIAGPDPVGRDVWHKGPEELTDAAAGVTMRTIAGTQSWAYDRSDPMVDICPFVAGSIALWALGTPRIHVSRFTPFALFG